MEALQQAIAGLELSGPRAYSRWSAAAWRQSCAGPAAQLWQALTAHAHKDKERVLVAYLTLLHAAVGLQYVSLTAAGELDTTGFLPRALCKVFPKLLAEADAPAGLAALAAVWNAGERLQTRAPWLDRYLSARLHELPALNVLEDFLRLTLHEGLEALPQATFAAPALWQVLDLAALDRRFLPGECHLATPAIVCVHDRLRDGVHTAVLLRQNANAVSLGPTPCLGQSERHVPPPEVEWIKALEAPALPEPCAVLATAAGFVVVSTLYSQRLWIARFG